MLERFSRVRRWSIWATLLAGGAVFQTAGCDTFLAGITAGLASSVANVLIRNVVSITLGLGNPSGGF